MFKDWFVTEEAAKSNINKIDIFDFDDTLVYVPSAEEAQDIITRLNFRAQSSGKEEIEQIPIEDYWHSPASMEYPIIPKPTPCAMLNQTIAKEFYTSQRDPKRLTIVMTGRSPLMKKNLERILGDFKMKPDRIYMMPREGKTLDNKIERIAKLLDEFPHVQEIEMWDDKGPIRSKLLDLADDNHVAEFKKFLNICKQKREHRDPVWSLKFKVNEVPPRNMQSPTDK